MDRLTIAKHSFSSRLFVGTGKFSSGKMMSRAIEASETEMVTVALRRVDFNNPDSNFLTHLDFSKYHFLPNTSGARNAEEAIRIAKLCRKASGENWLKLEVTPDPRNLLPDGAETLKATKNLVDEGFVVLPYIQADPILAKQLEEAGAATVMPLGSPIGSNKGLRTKDALLMIVDQAAIPIVIDAGLGAPSHAAEAMEIGADAVLVNTAIAIAGDPIQMALAFKKAVEAGRLAYQAQLGETSSMAKASSPLTNLSQQI